MQNGARQVSVLIAAGPRVYMQDALFAGAA